ncbi:hypothetical protein BC826DRAFT_1105990 [Russula brevipes]|nr:hypothetical protein BC826DRAFT_1105990 [Russula brevipes]
MPPPVLRKTSPLPRTTLLARPPALAPIKTTSPTQSERASRDPWCNGPPPATKQLQVTRTGWDMDPFVVVSFGKKVFRTRIIRHFLNPVWDKKLLFHVRKYERSFRVQFTVLDWDKLSSNDHFGDAAKLLIEDDNGVLDSE